MSGVLLPQGLCSVLAVPWAWNTPPSFLHSTFLLLSKAISDQAINIVITPTQILSPFPDSYFLLRPYR